MDLILLTKASKAAETVPDILKSYPKLGPLFIPEITKSTCSKRYLLPIITQSAGDQLIHKYLIYH